ncbi:glycosyltransferase family 4 protein [Candidatus Parcubacteria bacterium]|jgi:glycosyltransferase involved in cell wall biosynthesis|nr:glycosyltransferase family 4 protein [Candidatus Parcubacteria bacterium]MBT7228447.1 glycosyltransferase family 4 protein [Candidatus Parcubacteria bacterium]
MQPTKTLKNKRILYLVTQTKWGGAQKYVLELAEHFAKKNEVHIAYGETKNIDQRFLDIAEKLNIKTIPVDSLVRDISPTKEIVALPDLVKVLSKGNYNLVHLNSSKAGLIGSLAAKMYSMNPMNLRLRVVYTAHGFVFNEPLAPRTKKMYKMSEKFSTALQHLIITVSDYDKKSALENKIGSKRKLHTVHNGLDFGRYHFLDSQEARQQLNLSENKKYFGTIASFYKTKGYEFLLEAIKLLKEENSPLLDTYNWAFMGDGPELDNIKKLAKEYNVSDYVKFLGEKENAWKYLNAFDYFILPSTKEGLPYTILEAGLAKLPTISTQVGGIPEILTNDKTGLVVPPANPLSLAEAMKKLDKDQALSNTLAENNFKNIRENFGLQKTLTKTEELYLKLF